MYSSTTDQSTVCAPRVCVGSVKFIANWAKQSVCTSNNKMLYRCTQTG